MANTYHYPSLRSFDDVEIAGICDLVEEKLNETADRFEIEKRFSSYQEMIEATAPDAVYILVSPHHLFDIVIHCLARKIHVYIEKPPGVTTYQIQAMALKAEEEGLLSMVAFNRRYMPFLQQAKKMVEEKSPVSQCVSTFYKNSVNRGMIYFDGAIDILHCDAIHAVDTLRYMAGGEVVKVASSARSLYTPYANSWQALVEFDSGCVGVLLTNWSAGGRIHTFEMHGKGISAFLDWDNPGRILADGEGAVWRKSPAEAAGDDWDGKMFGFYQENRHFVDCLKAGRQPMTNFADAVKSMDLADQIYRNTL